MMEMTNEEICRNYKQAKHRQNQIKILADLNQVSVDEIRQILIDGGALKPKPKKESPAPVTETISNTDVNYAEHLKFLTEYVSTRLEEIEDIKKELRVVRDALNHICED